MLKGVQHPGLCTCPTTLSSVLGAPARRPRREDHVVNRDDERRRLAGLGAHLVQETWYDCIQSCFILASML